MCFFKGIKFELFPESPNIPSDYWRTGECDAEHHTRMKTLLRERAEQHRRINSGEESITIPAHSSLSEKCSLAKSGEFRNKQLCEEEDAAKLA